MEGKYASEELIYALDSVTWYNGLAEYVYKWTKQGNLIYEYNVLRRKWPRDNSFELDCQLEVIWMICVELFGNCGTSPRTGWIENIEGFKQFCLDITSTWRDSDDFTEE